MKTKFNLSVLWAVLAAALYALNSPVSKLLLESVTPTMMAAFLYLGAGLGMAALGLVRKAVEKAPRERHLSRKDLPYTIGMVVLDIAAPIFLMTGLARTAPANVSLLNNFEIVATSLIALVIFCIIKAINTAQDRLVKKPEESPKAPATKKCPHCMSEIDIKATRCPHCTSELL